MYEVQRWLLVVWLLIVGPLILAALPVRFLEPLRKLLLPLLIRGKLLKTSESAGKGSQKLTVPQGFFMHFYAVGLFWNSLLFFTSIGFALTCTRPSSVDHDNMWTLARHSTHVSGSDATGDFERYALDAWRVVVLLLLFEIHLTRRLYECLFVSSFDPSALMHLTSYFGGIGYYLMVPLTLFLQCFHDEGFMRAFQLYLTQALRAGPILLRDGPEPRDVIGCLGEIEWMAYIGTAVYMYGSVHQYACHEILALLRHGSELRSENKYGIPKGDWFELVSSAHYLAEIVIYTGLLIASGATSLAMWTLYLGVVANLYMTAKATHEWYLSKFENYPKSRHALFPYVG